LRADDIAVLSSLSFYVIYFVFLRDERDPREEGSN